MVKLWNAVRQDVLAFRHRLMGCQPPRPGLFTYRFTPPGGQVRMHLRIDNDRSGVLFVDVTEVIHLNPTAAEMTKWALDGMPRLSAEARIVRAQNVASYRVPAWIWQRFTA